MARPNLLVHGRGQATILHRNNLGYLQRIELGTINWMTAGSGIVHSERKPPEQSHQRHTRADGRR